MTDPPQDQALPAELQPLAAGFVLQDGLLVMPDETFSVWQEKLARGTTTDPRTIAEFLVAVAVKFRRHAGESASPAILQLCELAVAVLGAQRDARDMFAAAGLDVSSIENATGWRDAKRAPAHDAEKVEGTISPMGLQMQEIGNASDEKPPGRGDKPKE